MSDTIANLKEITQVLKNGAICKYMQQKKIKIPASNRRQQVIATHKKACSVICPIKLGLNEKCPTYIPHSPFPLRSIHNRLTPSILSNDMENLSISPTTLEHKRQRVKGKFNTFKDFNKLRGYKHYMRRRSNHPII